LGLVLVIRYRILYTVAAAVPAPAKVRVTGAVRRLHPLQFSICSAETPTSVQGQGLLVQFAAWRR